jgi:septation ring formation regulator EzrA
MKLFQIRGLFKRLAILGIMGVMVVGALIPASAFAASVDKPKCAVDDVKCIIAFGDKQIAERIDSLNTLSAKITKNLTEKKITQDQANELQADVSTNETGLNNLKTKLDGETVAKNAREDVKNIFVQFRIYAVVLPRDYRHLLLDVEINAREKLVDLEPAIQAAISKAPSGQQAKLNDLFSDYKKQLADAETQIDTAKQDIPQLTPENFNQNRATFEATRKSLDNATRTAKKDLHKAADDLHQIVKILGHDI